jgi:hypothetical protein
MAKENRRERIRRLTTPEGMRAAALRQQQRRGEGDHVHVIGGLRSRGGLVVLMAIEADHALAIVRPLRLTADTTRWNRWRTRQAATQFIARHQLADVHVLNLDWHDVLPAPADPR